MQPCSAPPSIYFTSYCTMHPPYIPAKILIGGAWPYANGSLHIGHIAGLLPGDILARYHRAIGDDVYFVSGSDCHGTPVAIRAKQENRTPQEISDFYHNIYKNQDLTNISNPTSSFTNV